MQTEWEIRERKREGELGGTERKPNKILIELRPLPLHSKHKKAFELKLISFGISQSNLNFQYF